MTPPSTSQVTCKVFTTGISIHNIMDTTGIHPVQVLGSWVSTISNHSGLSFHCTELGKFTSTSITGRGISGRVGGKLVRRADKSTEWSVVIEKCCPKKIKCLACPEKWELKLKVNLTVPGQPCSLNWYVMTPITAYVLCGTITSFLASNRISVWWMSDFYFILVSFRGLRSGSSPISGLPLDSFHWTPSSDPPLSYHPKIICLKPCKKVIPSLWSPNWRHSWGHEVSWHWYSWCKPEVFNIKVSLRNFVNYFLSFYT